MSVHALLHLCQARLDAVKGQIRSNSLSSHTLASLIDSFCLALRDFSQLFPLFNVSFTSAPFLDFIFDMESYDVAK